MTGLLICLFLQWQACTHGEGYSHMPEAVLLLEGTVLVLSCHQETPAVISLSLHLTVQAF